MFDLYLQVITILGYPQDFDATDDLWDCGIDELAGFITQTDSVTELVRFFDECDHIERVLKSLDYEIQPYYTFYSQLFCYLTLFYFY